MFRPNHLCLGLLGKLIRIMVFYPLQKSMICYRQEKNPTTIKLQIYSISLPSMVHHLHHLHHHHHHWSAWEQWRRGRQAGKTWARSTFANNKQHKAAGYCAAVARLPDKAKDLGCLFKIVSYLFKIVTCLFEIVNIWSSVLCSHIMPLFWPDTWSPLIQYDFQNTAEELLLGELKKNHFVVFFSPSASLIHLAFPLFSGSMGQWCVVVSNCKKHKLALNSLRAFSRRRQGDSEEFRGAWN